MVSQTPQTTITPSSSPTPDGTGETASWKTYTNSSYSYFINYPLSVTRETKIVKDFPSQVNNITHDYFKFEGGILEIYGVCGRGVQPIKQTDIIIGGQKAIKLYETNTTGIITAIPRPNSNESICFNFKLPDDPTKTQSVDVLFNQILSTFKFTQ